MNWDQVEGNWTQMKGKVKETWGDLTDSDIRKIEGKRDRLAGVLQERYGKKKEEIEQEIDGWLNRH
ncbi:MAG: CsbD family protein [Alphaproteobacteria bacterium]|nr:CsbD family protein [Alphaproteobacteria bacterium]MDX5417175.1 CsbD family protein [Alphaproteobacteria bacterium]MDX5494612.1 CsbD family protein [Alphaproteobacteria bacterium]